MNTEPNQPPPQTLGHAASVPVQPTHSEIREIVKKRLSSNPTNTEVEQETAWGNAAIGHPLTYQQAGALAREIIAELWAVAPPPAAAQEQPQRWTPAEREAIDRLKAEKDMGESAIIRQALRHYQMEHERQMGRATDLGPKQEQPAPDGSAVEESRLRSIVNETYKLLYSTFDHDEGNNGLPKAVNALILERDAAQSALTDTERRVEMLRVALEEIANNSNPIRDPLRVIGGDVYAADNRFNELRQKAQAALAETKEDAR